MTVRQWYFGVGAAIATLIPLSANADSVMNLPGSPNYNPTGSIILDFGGVTAEIPGAIGSGANGGSCLGVVCAETTYGAGVVTHVVNNLTNQDEWTGGQVSTSNPGGLAVAYVIYGIADKSIVTSGASQSIDNTGATASGSVIHIDLYSMSAANTPCFTLGCGPNMVTAAQVAGVVNPATSSTVFIGSTTFADFTFESGATPLNAIDMPGDGSVTLTQHFNTGNDSGDGNGFLICNAGPGCSDFTPVMEGAPLTPGTMDNTTGYQSDPTFSNLLTQIFLAYQIKAPTAGQATIGWGLQTKDPAYAITSPVPEPTSLALLGSALAFLGLAIHRRRKGMSA